MTLAARLKRTKLSGGLRIAGLVAALLANTVTFASSGRIDLQLNIQLHKKSISPDPQSLVVALEPTATAEPPQTTSATILQRDARFEPYISVVQRGSEIEFRNDDPFAHHVYSFSKTKSFEIPLHNNTQTPSPVALDRSGIIPIGCNIHDWMLGFIFVVDTPWFTFAEQQIAKFPEIAPGAYTAVIWHPSLAKPKRLPIEVSERQRVLTVNTGLRLKPASRRATPKQVAFGEDY